jgi:hypothetical protein
MARRGGLVQTRRTLLVTLVCVSSGPTAADASPGVVAGATAGGLVMVTIALPTSDGTDPRLRWEG